jgi:hypothetical protein
MPSDSIGEQIGRTDVLAALMWLISDSSLLEITVKQVGDGNSACVWKAPYKQLPVIC